MCMPQRSPFATSEVICHSRRRMRHHIVPPRPLAPTLPRSNTIAATASPRTPPNGSGRRRKLAVGRYLLPRLPRHGARLTRCQMCPRSRALGSVLPSNLGTTKAAKQTRLHPPRRSPPMLPPLRLRLHRARLLAAARGGVLTACSRPSSRPSRILWARWEPQHQTQAPSPPSLLPPPRPRRRPLRAPAARQGPPRRPRCVA